MKRIRKFTAQNGDVKVVIIMEVTTVRTDWVRPMFIDLVDEWSSQMFSFLGNCGFRLNKIKTK